MSTPAEIIAARVNGITIDGGEKEPSQGSLQSLSDSEESNSFLNGSDGSYTTTAPSVADESAFPTLGGKKSAVVNKSPSWVPTSESSSPLAGATSNGTKVKGSTIQDAFSLDVEDQLNVTRPEFVKILTYIKSETKTNIECTTSQHTKKRTFLISGKPEEVKLARRLVIKKLTKPVKISFNIPVKVRSKVIGPQGRTLKPIILAFDVKIDISNEEMAQDDVEDDDDIWAKVVKVFVEGDVEGCKHAKAQILQVVKEETKNLTFRLVIEAKVVPFAAKHLEPIVKGYPELVISIPDYKSGSSTILIEGEREAALSAKHKIQEALESLASKIVTEEVPIPKVKHQFLPIEQVLEENNVLIKLPTPPESAVKFIGQKKNISFAIENARKTTSHYKVEVLDMSKAHKGNTAHVKAVAALLRQNGTFKDIASTTGVVINVPSKTELEQDATSGIPLEIVAGTDESEKVKATRKAIVSAVNNITPDTTSVIDDIDEFLLNKVPETIDAIATENKIAYVILGKRITLFSNVSEEESEDFGFDSAENAGHAKIDKALNTLRVLASTLESVVLKVSSEKQKYIKGPKGTTLNLILSSVEPNTAVIKLSSNATESSSEELYIHGLRSSVFKIQNFIEGVLKDYEETGGKYFEKDFEVLSTVLSRVIGKNGSNLISLREKFGTKVDVEDLNSDSKEKQKNAKIFLSGPKFNVELCEQEILRNAKKWADETLVRLRVESEYHRRMIGPNGVYINKLQEKYNVRIRFPSSTNSTTSFPDAPKSKDEVTIKGPTRGVAKAEEELKELYKFEKENGFKETVKIPVAAISRVIGKSGETINDIADGCGVEYRFNRDSNSEAELGYTEIELTGSKKALKEAANKISEIVEELENFVSVELDVDPKYYRELIGQGGAVMREIISKAGGENLPRHKYYKLLSIPNEGSESQKVVSQGDKQMVEKVIEQIKQIVSRKEATKVEEYDLLKEKHKLIVGSLGSIRHSLQDKFDVLIEIPRPNDPSTIVRISGLPEQIEQAKAEIETLTKDDWNVSIDVPAVYHSLVSERGAIFKKLQTDYNVEVHHGNLTRKAAKLSNTPLPTPPESAFPVDDEKVKVTIVENEPISQDSEHIPWRLKGDEENTNKVAALIEKKLADAKAATYTGWYYSDDPSAFAKVVGPRGSNINRIRNKTATVISVPKSTDKNKNFIHIVGSQENIADAMKAIEELIK